MPSRASTSFLLAVGNKIEMQEIPECQCPLGLIPHFYHNSDGFSFGVLKCQCPHGLIPHFYLTGNDISVKQLSIVSMPSRASTSFLQYPFKNLGFMRFPEPVFAGIYQNILTIAVFRAC